MFSTVALPYSGSTTRGSRTIPAAVRRAVCIRDGGRCAYIGPAGRCEESGFIEFHHGVPFAEGGAVAFSSVSTGPRGRRPGSSPTCSGKGVTSYLLKQQKISADSDSLWFALVHRECTAPKCVDEERTTQAPWTDSRVTHVVGRSIPLPMQPVAPVLSLPLVAWGR
jgi:hypothetical protein